MDEVHISHAVPLAVSGAVEWAVLDADDHVISEGKCPNMILDGGLEFFCSYGPKGARGYLAVGTGSAEPVVTQTLLGAEVARTSSPDGLTVTDTFTQDAVSVTTVTRVVRVVTFAQAYNITEYGFSPTSGANTALAIRELFRDGTGTPVPISVQAGQKIRVTHSLTLVTSVGLSDVNFTVTNLGVMQGKGGWFVPAGASTSTLMNILENFLWDNNADFPFAFVNTAADATYSSTGPGPSSWSMRPTIKAARLAYVGGSKRMVRRFTLAEANANGTHYGWGIAYSDAVGGVGYRFAFVNPASVVKDDTKKITLDFEFKYARA